MQIDSGDYLDAIKVWQYLQFRTTFTSASTFLNAYSSGYTVGAKVNYNNKGYRCIVATGAQGTFSLTPDVDTDHWVKISDTPLTSSDTVYVDSLYIDNSFARVEMCDNATWANRAHCEIQPPTVWASGSITATFNQGSFISGSTAYLYVIDSAGNVNTTGYPLTIASASDTTVPVVTAFTLPSVSSSLVVPISSFTATDNTAVTGYLVNESATAPAAGDSGWSATAQSTYTFVTDGLKTLYAWAKDAANNVATSLSGTVTVDTTDPTISSIASTTTATTATITWTTNELATSTVSYGLTTGYGTASTSASSVTSHSITLSGLASATTYHFTVGSQDAVGNVATSSDATFTTSAAPDTTPPTVSTPSPSGELSAGTTATTISVTTETGATCRYSTTPNTAYASMTGSMTESSGTYAATVSSLSNSATYDYYIRCSDSAGNPTTSDTHVSFSVAAAASVPVVSSSGSGGGGGGGGGGSVSSSNTSTSVPTSPSTTTIQPAVAYTPPSVTSSVPNPSGLTEIQVQSILSVLDSFGIDQATLTSVTDALRGTPVITSATPPVIAAYSAPATFSRDLKFGMSGSDVRQLQQFLNNNGFVISQAGMGSPGQETTYFGQATKQALIKYQKANGIVPASGYLGPVTRGRVGL
jgi:hypothetical protein